MRRRKTTISRTYTDRPVKSIQNLSRLSTFSSEAVRTRIVKTIGWTILGQRSRLLDLIFTGPQCEGPCPYYRKSALLKGHSWHQSNDSNPVHAYGSHYSVSTLEPLQKGIYKELLDDIGRANKDLQLLSRGVIGREREHCGEEEGRPERMDTASTGWVPSFAIWKRWKQKPMSELCIRFWTWSASQAASIANPWSNRCCQGSARAWEACSVSWEDSGSEWSSEYDSSTYILLLYHRCLAKSRQP